MSDSHSFHILEQDADKAFFSGELQALVVCFYENERPLAGLSGLLDWRFYGEISNYLRAGAMSGATGQCAYLPMTSKAQTRTYHLIFMGCGNSSSPGAREKPSPETMKVLADNLSKLAIKKVGLSRTDFGGAPDEFFAKHLKGLPLWIVQ